MIGVVQTFFPLSLDDRIICFLLSVFLFLSSFLFFLVLITTRSLAGPLPTSSEPTKETNKTQQHTTYNKREEKKCRKREATETTGKPEVESQGSNDDDLRAYDHICLFVTKA